LTLLAALITVFIYFLLFIAVAYARLPAHSFGVIVIVIVIGFAESLRARPLYLAFCCFFGFLRFLIKINFVYFALLPTPPFSLTHSLFSAASAQTK